MLKPTDTLNRSLFSESPSLESLQKPPAKTDAARSKSYRQRRQDEGLKAVKCLLPPDEMLYLAALCDLYDVTLSEAIGLAVTALITGTIPRTLRSPVVPHGFAANGTPTIKRLRPGGTDARTESPRCEA